MLTRGIILLSRQSKCVTNSCYRGQWVRLYRILQNWEIRETGNLSCEYFCNWQSCPSKGWLCRESSETVLKKVEIGGKNLRKHFLENISFRLFQNFFFNTPCTAMWKKKQFWRFGKNGLVTHTTQYNLIYGPLSKLEWRSLCIKGKFEQKMLQMWKFFDVNLKRLILWKFWGPVKLFWWENSIVAAGSGLDKSGHVFPIHSVTSIHPRFHNNIVN